MNLLITCSRHFEEETNVEISKILQELGDDSPVVQRSIFSGIIFADTQIDPFIVIKEIKKIVLEEPWRIRYCHRIIPIKDVVSTRIENIVDSVNHQIKTINDTDTYRISVENRGSDLSSKELIGAIAKNIPNKVSLEDFEWNINIQIVGGITGISILKEDDIISMLKLKRDLME